MTRPRFESFVPIEQIETVYGNAEVAKELTRLEALQSEVDAAAKEMQKRVREAYDGDERERLLETMDLLRQQGKVILDEIRRVQKQFPATR